MDLDDPADWDRRYAEAERVWSGEPNGALVAEVAGLSPGRALDIGCGEGADAVWLAQRGWQVTALDVSQVALDRAALEAGRAGVEVTWLRSGLEQAVLPEGGFDLVSAQYPVLRCDGPAAKALLAAVAPGGTLLFVHHDREQMDHAREQGWDPADYLFPVDVAALLDDGWQVEADEKRPRHVTTGAGAGHVADLVLKARRR